MIPVLLTVDSVDNQQIFLLDKTIEIGVVNSPACFSRYDRVLGSSRNDIKGFGIVTQDVLKEFQSPGTPEVESPHMGDVKKSCSLAGSQMLLHNAGGVENGHLPTAEFHHLGTQ